MKMKVMMKTVMTMMTMTTVNDDDDDDDDDDDIHGSNVETGTMQRNHGHERGLNSAHLRLRYLDECTRYCMYLDYVCTYLCIYSSMYIRDVPMYLV
jgi:hypothetical protein